MKLDQIPDKETGTIQVVSKKREIATSTSNSGSILELLNPLKSVNINSNLHSFNNFRESKESIEALLKAQSNLVFYVLHQNFMCDDSHKEFFKNMVGRFYDLPEMFWGYYRGINYFSEDEKESLNGLVLLENGPLYLRTLNGDYNFIHYNFKAVNSRTNDKILFNKYCLIHLHGFDNINYEIADDFAPINSNIKLDSFNSRGFNQKYEENRFRTNLKDKYVYGYWDIVKDENFNSIFWRYGGDVPLRYMSLYASYGIDDLDATISHIMKMSTENGRNFSENDFPKWNNDDLNMIRSISQTFEWSKNYIFENEDLLNLDVLGLNMTVPWDMDLVKFFIKRGYGGRMSENKAVFDKVFKPLLTDEILDMLFRLEYEKY